MSAHKRNDLVWYLLLHQGVGVEYAFEGSRTDALERHVRSVNDMCHTLGITIVVAELIQSKKRQVQERYLFCFSDFVRNDGLAVRVAEAYEFAMGICAYPVWGPMDDGCVLRIPKNMVPSDHKISLNALVDLEKGRKGEDRTLEHPDYQLSCCCGSTLAREEVAWHLASLLLVREDLLRACRFWLACQEDVLFFPGDIEQALESYDMPPKTQKDQTRFETALQYAFKTVEAIIGDPPKNDSKFFDRLRNAGSDPRELVGYRGKEELHQVIREMNRARDVKAAHGSTRKRTISIGEILSYQACAKYILVAALEKELGRGLFE